MLKLICGEAGTGKSTLLRERLKKAVESGIKTVYLVPDQFSFEAEKLIYRTVPHEYSRNCRVTMFSREAQRILHLYGETKEYADDIAKRIVVRLALEEAHNSGELEYYRGQSQRQGFPEFALGMISDMRGAGISPSALRGMLAEDESMSETLTRKLNDISVIYSAYDSILTRNFDDRLDDIRRASELILQTDIFSGTEVFIDEFDNFSGNQQGFIKALLDKAANVTIALTCDYPQRKERRFEAVCRLIDRISGDGERDVTRLTEVRRRPKEVRIIEARDKWQECDWICAEIRELMASGARCRSIAVLAPDSASTRILDSALRRYEIPAFADIPEPLMAKSFVRFCIYTLRALSFSTDDLLRYIKSGFVRGADRKLIRDEYIDVLEMLCRQYDLRKKDWLKPFPKELDGLRTLQDKSITRDVLETVRKSIVDPLAALKKSFENADGAEMTKLLCDFVCNTMDVRNALYGKCVIGHSDAGKPIYDPKLLDEYSELWDDTITVFESAFRALRSHNISIEDYTEILSDVFTATTVAKPPQTLDAVTVGDTERSRFTDVRHVFICGFSRGIMPRPAPSSQVFTPSESEQLTRLGIPVVSDRLSRYSQELFTVYRCINIPSERLYITYPLMGTDGSFLEPSPEIAAIKEETGAVTEGADNFGASHYCRNGGSAERYLAHIYRDRSKAGERRALMKTVPAGYAAMLRSAAGEKPDRDRHVIPEEYASKLLVLNSYSPSAINLMNRCKFAFFCRYGLGLSDDTERSIDALLVGNLIHFCLQRILTDHMDKRDTFLSLSDADIAAHVAESVQMYEKEAFLGGFGGTERFSYQFSRLGRYAVKSAARIRDELQLSGFYPEALEQRLSFPFGGITVAGVCDRIDSMTADGKKYIRVVDYKRSSRDFSLDDIYRGENIQTLLYMFGICGNDPKARPSSVSYMPVGKMSYERSDGSDIAQKTTDSMQKYIASHSSSGFYLSDSPEREELSALNSALIAKYGKKRGGFITHTEISPEIYRAIESYTRSYLGAKVLETKKGMVSACPSDTGLCSTCAYAVFCGKYR
ncbi:MAG: PD-(D/E)XK nuclease family protein [Ruminiclostridium sp.]|nr:PD-(D/E)XK nuclease family protein [Ruminiclostridium sp.]